MKTVSKFLATIMLLISSSAVFAQIELVHSIEIGKYGNGKAWYFTGTIYSEEKDYMKRDFSGIQGFFETEFDENKNTLSMKTFSNDFSSITTKTFQFPSFDGYKINRGFIEISQHIFNNDDEFEFIIGYQKIIDEQSNENQKLILVDSKGNLIKDFGNAHQIYWGVHCLYIINSQPYILIDKYDTEYYSTIEIYSVPTTVNPNQLKSATISNSTLLAFPNPAKMFVNLSYNVSGVEDAEMVITDASGRVVERRIVNAMQDNLRLNVANYKRGMYFYEVQGFTGRFIVE